ncbi:MAG: Ldh family oxidoreductase [Pseudomonadota bacterium]
MSASAENLPIKEAEALVARALTASGAAPAVAALVAEALVAAEIDGQSGHGFSRVSSYAAQARVGKVVGDAAPFIEEQAQEGGRERAFFTIDAAHGFAYPALALAIETLAARAPRFGIAAAAIRRSHHCGQLGAHVERLAERGLIGVMVANAPKAIAPWGGSKPFFGTNPIAFGAPIPGAAPLVIDLSVSKVARGKVMAASKAGERIPEGWALDPDGRPTTDPEAAIAGTMIPIGEAKGAALALMVEVLASSLTGAVASHEASPLLTPEGPPPGVGQFLIAIDPGAGAGGAAGFAARMTALIEALGAQEGARLPGIRRLAAREAAARAGVPISAKMRAEIEAIAADA